MFVYKNFLKNIPNLSELTFSLKEAETMVALVSGILSLSTPPIILDPEEYENKTKFEALTLYHVVFDSDDKNVHDTFNENLLLSDPVLSVTCELDIAL